jgi:prevent-host-death family protein
MQRSVSAREANQQFSRILRDVEAGAEILVTRRGRPVARIVPAQPSGERQLTPEQEAAHARSMARLRKGWDLGGGKFDRDELYDD